MISGGLTSGKHTKNYGKSPFLIGKSTVDEPFSTAMLNFQGVEMVWNTSFFCLCSCGSCYFLLIGIRPYKLCSSDSIPSGVLKHG